MIETPTTETPAADAELAADAAALCETLSQVYLQRLDWRHVARVYDRTPMLIALLRHLADALEAGP